MASHSARGGGAARAGERTEVVIFTALGVLGVLMLALFGYQRYSRANPDLALPVTTRAVVASTVAVTVPADFGRNTLAIPTEQVSAPIQGQQVDSRGYLGIPADVHTVGYYTGAGRLDGGAGDLVVAGHVNYVGQGTGALGRIATLKVGDAIITRGESAPQAWRVISLESYLKTDGLPAAMFRATGRRQLTLVTCGGVLDRRVGSYLSNVVVTATPVRTIVK